MKIVFLHSMLRDYRINLFNSLYERMGVEFIFTCGSAFKKHEKIFGQAKMKYTLLEDKPNFIFNEDFDLGLFSALRRYDLVIASIPYRFPSIATYLSSRFSSRKYVLWDETWMLPSNMKYSVGKKIAGLVARNAEHCIVAGSKAKEFYLKMGVPENRISVAPNSATSYEKKVLGSKERRIFRKKLGISEEKFVFLYLGRVVKYKGLDLLLRAFSEHEKERKNSVLIIAGDGPFSGECKALSKELGIRNVSFLGRVSEEEKSALFSISNVFVLPSRFMMQDNVCCEAWGLSLNEAMSAGLPVISTTAVGAAYDLIIEGKTGYLIEPEAQKILDRMEEMESDPKKTKKMGESAQKRVRNNFSWEGQFEVFSRVITLIMEGSPK
ncbi:MAG: glycosyltransferase family 4 protein [Candidatus Micrarchaeia archaeon]